MGKNKVIRITTPEFFVVLAYVLYISEEILNYTQFRGFLGWSIFRQLIIGAVAVFVGVGIFSRSKVSVKWLMVASLIVLFGFVISISNDLFSQTVIILLFIISGTCLKSDRVIRYHWAVVSVLVAFTLFMYIIGVYTPDTFYKVSSDGVLLRQYLGFAYTTYPPNYLIHLMLTFYASRKKSISLADTFIFLVINYIFYRLTYTYAVYYEVYLIIVVLWILKLKPTAFSGKVFRVMFTLFMPLLAIISVILAYIYTPANPILFFLNQLMSSRLSLAHTGIARYGVTLFGNAVQWSGGRYGVERVDAYFYVDSSYINIILTYGIIALIFVIISFALLSNKAHKKGNIKLCVILAFLAIHSFTDPQLLELKYNPFLIILLAAYFPSMEPLLDVGRDLPSAV